METHPLHLTGRRVQDGEDVRFFGVLEDGRHGCEVLGAGMLDWGRRYLARYLEAVNRTHDNICFHLESGVMLTQLTSRIRRTYLWPGGWKPLASGQECRRLPT